MTTAVETKEWVGKVKNRLRVIILIMALIASGAGAASGVVLSGYATGNVNIGVSQPIQIETPNVAGLPTGRARFGAVSAEGTEFSAAAQLYQGENATVEVPIYNRANVDHVMEITVSTPALSVPTGANPSDYQINISILGNGVIQDIVQVGPYKWKGTLSSTAKGRSLPTWDGIRLNVALGALVPPGYYGITGQIQVVSY